MANLIEAENLGKRYGSRWLFRRVSLSLTAGDLLVIRGANGSGKSTLARGLAHLIELTEGKVRVDGDPRLAIGYAALDMAVYPHLTPVEHLEMAAELRGAGSVDLDRFGLESCRNTRGQGLSTGQKMRLKIAMAVQVNPPVLILDEPGASLDDAGRAVVEEVVRTQRKTGCVVVATNDPREGMEANLEFRLDD